MLLQLIHITIIKFYLEFRRPAHKERKLKKIERPSYLKPRERSQPSLLDNQITEIDKQLKNIQNQKKEINRIISRELKDRKYRWQEVKDRASFLNMKDLVNKAEDHQMKKIRETLGNSIQEVRNFNQSLSDFRYSNNSISDRIKIANAQNDVKFKRNSRGDNEVTSFSKNICTEDSFDEKIEPGNINFKSKTQPILSRASKSILNRNLQLNHRSLEKVNSDSEPTTAQDFSRLSISENPYYSILQKNNDEFKSPFENKMTVKPESFKNIQRLDHSVSSQANSVPSNFIKKYPVLQNMLPEVFKSEFMKKSCCFD